MMRAQLSTRPRCPGFTLVEVLVATMVLGLFLTGVYTLFFGGQRVAGKAAWLQNTVTDLRNAELIITKALQSTSYPTTLLPSNMFDAGGTSESDVGANAALFYVRIPSGLGLKTAPALKAANNGVVMSMVQAMPEKQGFGAGEDRVGSLTWHVFRMEASPDRADQGILIWEERQATFNTVPPLYAINLNAVFTAAPQVRRQVLVRNVSEMNIRADSVGHQPAQITVTITAVYPKDVKLSRQGSSAAMPNVGIFAP